MTLTQALGLGVLQGATEFLPISSSGHLALAQNLLPGLSGPLLLFDVVVHLGTMLAIVILLRRRVAGLVRAGLSFVPGFASASEVDRRWVGLVALGTVPTVVVALLLHDAVSDLKTRPAGVGAALLVTAALLLGSERMGRRTRGAAELSWLDALACGLAQGIAVIPGISRSGATVAAGLWRDVEGAVAVEFSLLLSIPAVIGANLYEALRTPPELAIAAAPLAVGFAASLVTGIAAVKALQWVVVRRRLAPFALYCALVGAGAISLG